MSTINLRTFAAVRATRSESRRLTRTMKPDKQVCVLLCYAFACGKRERRVDLYESTLNRRCCQLFCARFSVDCLLTKSKPTRRIYSSLIREPRPVSNHQPSCSHYSSQTPRHPNIQPFERRVNPSHIKPRNPPQPPPTLQSRSPQPPAPSISWTAVSHNNPLLNKSFKEPLTRTNAIPNGGAANPIPSA